MLALRPRECQSIAELRLTLALPVLYFMFELPPSYMLCAVSGCTLKLACPADAIHSSSLCFTNLIRPGLASNRARTIAPAGKRSQSYKSDCFGMRITHLSSALRERFTLRSGAGFGMSHADTPRAHRVTDDINIHTFPEAGVVWTGGSRLLHTR